MSQEIGFEVHLKQSYEQVLEKTTAALKAEGFGVLTKIDVRATLKEKLDEEFRPYAILGACNPPLAHRALVTEPGIGLMLPCNVTVEADSAEKSIVRILNPKVMMGMGELSQNEALRQVANEAYERLKRVSKALSA